MAVIDPEKVSRILVECAETYILPRYKQLEDHEVSSKTGPQDLVTQADIDVEAHLERVLPDIFPGSVVVGEEGVSRGTSSLDTLNDPAQPVWVVDPVDGTHNFVHHKREFAVMLACVIEGKAQHGWIYDVLGEDMAFAERGCGSFIGSQRLQVAKENKISELTGHISRQFFPKQYGSAIKEGIKQLKEGKTLRCAGHEYLKIAKGQAHFSLYSHLNPWDHLPGSLIIEEAGGFVAKWDKTPYRPQDRHVGLIAAASEENWNQAFNVFLSSFDSSSSAP